MIDISGTVIKGVSNFSKIMKSHPEAFLTPTGERLFPGTINVSIDRKIKIREEFRINGSDIGRPKEDFLFEKCLINGVSAYRIRPLDPISHGGGHGDDVLEISCVEKIDGINCDDKVTITLFRDEDSL